MQSSEISSAATRGPTGPSMTIGVLSITAVILLVGVLVVSTINSRAMAIGQTDRGGDYIVVTSQFNSGTEAVIVTDAATQQMIVYAWVTSAGRLDIWDRFDLKRLTEGVPNRDGRGGRRR